MFWFIFPNFLIQVHCSFDYLYGDKEWVSPSQQLPFQDFKPSSKYESSNSDTRYTNAEYPNTAYTETIYSNLVDPTLSLYDYNILADNFLDTEDLLATNSDIEGAEQRRKYVTVLTRSSLFSEEIDRQVTNPVGDVAPFISGLTPFLATSALIVGIRLVLLCPGNYHIILYLQCPVCQCCKS